MNLLLVLLLLAPACSGLQDAGTVEPHSRPDPVPRTSADSGSGTIRGHVVDSSGKPVPGACLHVRPAPGSPRKESRIVRCDDRGAFLVPDWPAGAWVVHVSEGLGFAWEQCAVQLAEAETRDVDIEVRVAPIVRGKIYAFGRPAANVEYHTSRLQGFGTGNDGSYEVPFRGPGQSDTLCIHPPWGGPYEFTITAPEWGEVIEMDMDLGSARLGGTVLEAESGLPIEEARVWIQLDPHWALHPSPNITYTAADGSWQLDKMPAGAHTLHVSARGFRDASRGLVVPVCNPSPPPIETRLEPE